MLLDRNERDEVSPRRYRDCVITRLTSVLKLTADFVKRFVAMAFEGKFNEAIN